DDGIWHQLSVRLEGPAARQLHLVFLHDWILHGGRLGPSREPESPASRDGVATQVVWWGPADDAPAVKVLLALLGAARERVVIATPYFVPDRPVLLALATAALRGVRVDVVVPARSDQRVADAAARAMFEELIRAGVRIHLHGDGVLHAKCISVDDRVAVVGSANGDRRSFYLDEEVMALLYDRDTAVRVRERQERWMEAARPATREDLEDRPLWRRTADDLAALASPLL
ncbi:MAG: phospholipase D-like domain-containing protein, partial [Myxococcota bacterium]|nr:phospholipase D-like domain-containing protein [Myxococcota bacterium]